MDVSENSGTPKSSILIGFSILNHPFWDTPIFGNTHIAVPSNGLQYPCRNFQRDHAVRKQDGSSDGSSSVSTTGFGFSNAKDPFGGVDLQN